MAHHNQSKRGAMTQDEIIAGLHKLLDQHLKGMRGGIGERQYKSDFFTAFRNAYDEGHCDESTSPRLTGDALRQRLMARWFDPVQSQNVKRAALLDEFLRMWDEWRYAWDQR